MKKRAKGVSINQSKRTKELFVRAVAGNNEKLHHTEGFKQKESAFKNIIAVAKLYSGILTGMELVTDEKGALWVYNGKKFVRYKGWLLK